MCPNTSDHFSITLHDLLNFGDPEDMKQFYVVNDTEYNENQFAFDCPFCFDKYKKDKTPKKNAKHLKHWHGSGGIDMRYLKPDETRVEPRSAHCNSGNFPSEDYSEFKIVCRALPQYSHFLDRNQK